MEAYYWDKELLILVGEISINGTLSELLADADAAPKSVA
jgi:hypothetical protein